MVRNKATKRARGGGKPGHPPFIPTDDQRRFVTAMSGIRMTWEEIRQLVINPTTGEPITKTTLARTFRRELADGKAKLKSIIATRFYEALDRGDSWATQMGLKTQFGWKPDGNGGFIMPPDPGDGPRPTLNVVFVKPDPKMLEEDDEPRLIEHAGPAIDIPANPPSSGVPIIPIQSALAVAFIFLFKDLAARPSPLPTWFKRLRLLAPARPLC